ncbi:hypothetical protein [Calidithermus roseus]|uniref:DUF6839 domain-containing protein n=1 Tax=Calidithermus roseus TaxID=1644118 RepID=A0A399EPX9_9DEIN|nr:hypothetical protein [Calidithermus roseus]RIH85593.1 hypothetical protein Mrose_02157 [Calidithermus roseus]
MKVYRARWRGGSAPLGPRPGSHGKAWPIPHPSECEEGSWAFEQGGKAWYCDPERDLEILGPWEEASMRVVDLQDERYMLLSDSQDRRAVLEDLGLLGELPEWPHLLVWAENGELLEVWGCRFSPPLLEDPVVPLLPRQGEDRPVAAAEASLDDPDWLETKEWEDFGGPELPAEW